MTLKELKKLFPTATDKTWHRHSNGGGWVENTAKVDISAFVGENARVCGNALVCGNARVCGECR